MIRYYVQNIEITCLIFGEDFKSIMWYINYILDGGMNCENISKPTRAYGAETFEAKFMSGS